VLKMEGMDGEDWRRMYEVSCCRYSGAFRSIRDGP
jgi:hypothetical protein